MGFNVQLIAVSGKAPSQVRDEFGVDATGEYEVVPESPVVGAHLVGGVYLLYINSRLVAHEADYSRLSRNGSLVALSVSENVCYSVATAWRDGTEQWMVHHDGRRHLETRGQLPLEYESISTRLLAQQEKDEHTDFVFDVPVELFVSQGGIRYDEDPPGAGPKPWEILALRKSRLRQFFDGCFDFGRVR